MRKILLESVAGSSVRDANQLTQLADYLGARKHSLLDMSKSRIVIEDNEKLAPLVEKLARKQPEGDRIIGMDWKLKAGHFYELDNISDVVKGHHSVFKV